MLLRTLHFPSVYLFDHNAKRKSGLDVIRLLKALEYGDLIVTDPKGVLFGRLLELVQSWPETIPVKVERDGRVVIEQRANNARNELMMLLRRFETKDMFARLEVKKTRGRECDLAGCDLAWDLARAHSTEIDAIVAGKKCLCHDKVERRPTRKFPGKVVQPAHFDDEHPFKVRLDHSRSLLVQDDVEAHSLDNQLWAPLLSDIKWLEIYDRSLGHAVYEDFQKNETGFTPKQLTVLEEHLRSGHIVPSASNAGQIDNSGMIMSEFDHLTVKTSGYGASLEYLCGKIHQRRTQHGHTVEVRIMTELRVRGDNLSPTQVEEVMRSRLVIENMINYLNSKWNERDIHLSVDIRLGRGGIHGMSHDRYIFTNRLSMSSQRGLDITSRSGYLRIMKGFTATYIDRDWEAVPRRSDGYDYDPALNSLHISHRRVEAHFNELMIASDENIRRLQKPEQ